MLSLRCHVPVCAPAGFLRATALVKMFLALQLRMLLSLLFRGDQYGAELLKERKIQPTDVRTSKQERSS